MKIELINEENVEDVLAKLVNISADGYPYPLRDAHEEAKIDQSTVLQVLSALNLELEETGREVVENE